MDDLTIEFVTETSESLAALDLELVRLERNPNDSGLLSGIFRLVHTIKGTCGFIGLPRLEQVAHAGENLLGKLRDGELAVTPEAVSLILECLDRIRALTRALEATGAEPAGDDASLILRLDGFANGGPALAAAKPAEPDAGKKDTESAVAQQSVRVNLELLETLMTTVGELVLTRNQALQILRTQGDSAFAAPLQRLDRVTSELQESVLKARMQPIGNAWAKLPRLVRDLARELGKKIDLEMLGADTELDRQVLEMIKDPLTHMVRNAGDHGLESIEDRRKAGKPETGRITLNAYHQGGHIVIEIADDGRGLPIEKIKAKLLQNRLATAAELAAMTPQQIQQRIFEAGFSTAAKVTSVSGRGVGMDVVRTNIEKIGGTVELRSKEGEGTRFTIKIPVTLAIVSALIVECAGERFAIPQTGVAELVRVGGSSGFAIEHVGDAPVLRLRDRLLPLVALRQLLALDPVGDAAPAESFIVVAQVGASSFGIMVDRVFDTEEIVVKPLAPILRDIAMFSGNTILGDGAVIMILDPSGIAPATGQTATGTRAVADKAAPSAAKPGDKVPLVLFRAGGETPKAVPLALVARLEELDRKTIERANGKLVVQYRGRLMPLIPMQLGQAVPEDGRQPVLVFSDRNRSMGLIVDRILDIVEDRLDIELAAAAPGRLGSAVVAGTATDILDTGFYLTQAHADWFGDAESDRRDRTRRLLLVDDSPFFRNLMAPLLSASGYQVTAVENANRALELCEAGDQFDIILSDIEMPGMDGFEFAAAVKRGERWRNTPMVALSAHATPDTIARGRAVGFADHVAKFDRDGLLHSLSTTMTEMRGAA